MRINYPLSVMRYPLTFLCLFLFSGCGYTTGSLLPPNIKNIYIENFANSIPITEEVSDMNRYKTYRPMLEVDITQAIIDKFIYDGHLRVTQRRDADVILTGALVAFRREPTKYGDNDTIEQYRIAIMVNMELKEVKPDKTIWKEAGFAGSAYYYISGPQASSENNAVANAVDDLARRVVERTVEVW